MSVQPAFLKRFALLEQAIAEESVSLLALQPGAAFREERKALFYEEIQSSTRLSGARLSLPEARALLDRDQVLGEHRFSDYLLVAGYARAASYIASQTPTTISKQRPLLRVDELLELHMRVVTGASNTPPGTWRRTTLPAFADGMVPPPAWRIAAEMRSFVDRLAAGPPHPRTPLLWVAEALARFERIQPFSEANGRVGRLLVNLLLRRLDLPPFIITPRRTAAYLTNLRRADAQEPRPLGCSIAESVLDGFTRLRTACEPDEALLSLAGMPAKDRAALYKAAERGRLRTVRRSAGIFTTQSWLTAYRASRSLAGRPRR